LSKNIVVAAGFFSSPASAMKETPGCPFETAETLNEMPDPANAAAETIFAAPDEVNETADAASATANEVNAAANTVSAAPDGTNAAANATNETAKIVVKLSNSSGHPANPAAGMLRTRGAFLLFPGGDGWDEDR